VGGCVWCVYVCVCVSVWCVCVCVCVGGRKATVQLKFRALLCNTSEARLTRANKGS